MRCAAGQPWVRFEVPPTAASAAGGLRLRGDVELQLVSTSGLVLAEEVLGWATVHTSFLPEGCVLPKAQVDLVHRDGRFPSSWSLHMQCDVEAPPTRAPAAAAAAAHASGGGACGAAAAAAGSAKAATPEGACGATHGVETREGGDAEGGAAEVKAEVPLPSGVQVLPVALVQAD